MLRSRAAWAAHDEPQHALAVPRVDVRGFTQPAVLLCRDRAARQPTTIAAPRDRRGHVPSTFKRAMRSSPRLSRLLTPSDDVATCGATFASMTSASTGPSKRGRGRWTPWTAQSSSVLTSAARYRYGPPMRIAAAATFALLVAAPVLAQQTSTHWVGTWAAAPTWRPSAATLGTGAPPLVPQAPAPVTTAAPQIEFNNQTLRQIVHTTIGGSRVRAVFSNAFGTGPVRLGAASLSLRAKDSAIVPSSSRPLLFSGAPSITIPAGAAMVSDPVELSYAPMSDLAVDVFLPMDTTTWTSPLTTHAIAAQTNYVSAAGNFAGAQAFPVSGTMTSWFLLSRLEVDAPAGASALVAIGDSITDGTRSTPDTNSRFPDQLTRRLQSDTRTRNVAVLNQGIAGNRLLSETTWRFGLNLLGRWDRDVLAQSGVRYVLVLEGINDIGGSGAEGPRADDLIAAHRQVVERAHARGLLVYGATLTPFEGAGYFGAEREAKRQAVNTWIRTANVYDAVVDFDMATRDPQHPTRLLPAYNSGDNLHPNDAGYKAMAEAIDLSLFTR